MDAGFIQKDSRFRDNNRGQTSNLYTLVFNATEPTPEQDNNPDHGDHIEPAEQTASTGSNQPKTAEHITFADIAPKQEQTPSAPQETISEVPQQHEAAPNSREFPVLAPPFILLSLTI